MSDLSRSYPFKTSGGNELIPVADGSFFTDEMSEYFKDGQCFLQFLNSSAVPVTPTGGTVTFSSGVYPNQFLRDGNEVTINAADVIAGDALYPLPTFNSFVRFSRMTLSGVTGAAFVKAMHWRIQ